jgi:predicted DNA-binding protein with PD1-like motif
MVFMIVIHYSDPLGSTLARKVGRLPNAYCYAGTITKGQLVKFASLNDHTFALRLELGEDVHTAIQSFCAGHGIRNATVQGIGSLQNPTVAHYSIVTKNFTDEKLDGIYEVTSLLGNIALVENQPFAHVHVTVTGRDMLARGGHLVKGECSATLELILTAYQTDYTKVHSTEIGLKIWDFEATA